MSSIRRIREKKGFKLKFIIDFFGHTAMDIMLDLITSDRCSAAFATQNPYYNVSSRNNYCRSRELRVNSKIYLFNDEQVLTVTPYTGIVL